MDLLPIVVAGAAGAFVKEVASNGVEWLIQLVGSHSKSVQAQVEENARHFLVRLAERVQRLEEELPADQEEIFDSALGHPSSSLLMQKALLSASITDNDERHSILSELIAQRLSADCLSIKTSDCLENTSSRFSWSTFIFCLTDPDF